jgi:NADPH:quinone reductase-like Zn-dependent oxidoreductase
MVGSQRFGSFNLRANRDDLAFVVGLLETGAITPIIDRRYTLPDVPEAIRYVEAGRATGKVVISSKTADDEFEQRRQRLGESN